MNNRDSDVPGQELPAQAAISTPLAPGKALLTLVGVMVVVAGYIALTTALGTPDFWAGFLFILYWGGIQHTDTELLPASIVGAFFGIFLLYMSHALPDWLGDAGLYAFFALMLAVIYCQIAGLFTSVINLMTMLYLTVGTIPVIQEHGSVADIALALVLGMVYFLGIILGGKQLMAKKREGVQDSG
jgi:hypothetical protein